MRAEIAAICAGLDLDGPQMPRAGAAELGPPGGTFLVGIREGEPVFCGGVKRLDDRACEIERDLRRAAGTRPGGGAPAARRA